MRQQVYIGATLESHLAKGDREQMQQYAHLFKPVLAWLAERSMRLQVSEDAHGSFSDDCQNHLHVRAFKGARIDCDDIRQEIEEILKQSP